jgi:hypothetical protein
VIVDPVTGLTLSLYIKYSTHAEISSLPLYDPTTETSSFQLFDMEIIYTRENVDSLNHIADVKNEMFVLNMITIGFACLSMVLIIIFSVLYLRLRKRRSMDVLDTLLEEEKSASLV